MYYYGLLDMDWREPVDPNYLRIEMPLPNCFDVAGGAFASREDEKTILTWPRASTDWGTIGYIAVFEFQQWSPKRPKWVLPMFQQHFIKAVR